MIARALRLSVPREIAKQTRPLFIFQTRGAEPQSAMVIGPSASVHEFREVVNSSQNIIIIAGAGLSAASGDRLPNH
jgi:hypothetical protein